MSWTMRRRMFCIESLNRKSSQVSFADPLLDAVERGMVSTSEASAEVMTVLIVGTSLRCGSRIDNCAVVIHGGRIFGVFPKTYPPTYREFYEARHFASGARLTGLDITIGPTRVPFGVDLLFDASDVPGLGQSAWVPADSIRSGTTVIATTRRRSSRRVSRAPLSRVPWGRYPPAGHR